MMYFNYDKLMAMDMVVCGGGKFLPSSCAIRAVSAGWREMFNIKIPVHTGMIVKVNGQILMAEMLANGLALGSLDRYAKFGSSRYVLDVRRHPKYRDGMVRRRAQERIAVDLRRTLGYDWSGILEFVSKRVKDNPKRYYCSEYYYYQTKEDGVQYPPNFREKVSPYDLSKANGFVPVDWKVFQ